MSGCATGSKNCNFTCPKGGTFYVCPDAPHFVGCCSSDPCKNTQAPYCRELSPASYNVTVHEKILGNQCLGSESDQWYTCNSTKVPFMGCCKKNPCQNDGCASEDLIPSAWSQSRQDQYQLFLDGASPSTTTSSSPSATGTAPVGSDTPSEEGASLSTPVVAGIGVGAGLVVLIIGCIIFWLCRRRRKAKKRAIVTLGPGEGEFSDRSGTQQMYHSSKYQMTPEQTSPLMNNYQDSASGSLPAYSAPSTPGHKRLTTDSTGTNDMYRLSHQSQHGQNLQVHGLGVQGISIGPQELDSRPASFENRSQAGSSPGLEPQELDSTPYVPANLRPISELDASQTLLR